MNIVPSSLNPVCRGNSSVLCSERRIYINYLYTVKPVLNGHSQKDQKLVFKTKYRLMKVKSIAECSPLEHSAILSTFIKLPFIIKTFVLSIFEWPLKTGFTVCIKHQGLQRITSHLQL